MECIHCKEQIRDSAKFCPFCGQPVASAEEKSADENVNPTVEEKPAEKKAEVPAVKSEEKAAEKKAETPAVKSEKKTEEKAVEKEAEAPAVKSEKKTEEKPAEKKAEAPAVKSEMKTEEKPAEKKAEAPAVKSEKKTEEKLAEKKAEAPAVKSAQSVPTEEYYEDDFLFDIGNVKSEAHKPRIDDLIEKANSSKKPEAVPNVKAREMKKSTENIALSPMISEERTAEKIKNNYANKPAEKTAEKPVEKQTAKKESAEKPIEKQTAKKVSAEKTIEKQTAKKESAEKPIEKQTVKKEPAEKPIEKSVTAEKTDEKPVPIKKKSRKGVKGIVAAAAAVVIVGGIFALVYPNVIKPSIDYNAAIKNYEKGNYSEALSGFEELGDYKDSAGRTTSARYMLAVSFYEKGDYSSAAAEFEKTAGYSDSAEKLTECSYKIASELLDNSEYELAAEKFAALGDYSDSVAKYERAVFSWADFAAKSGDYVGAIDIIGKSTVSEDNAKTEIIEYRCEAAAQLAEKKDFNGAIELIKPISNESHNGRPVSSFITEYVYNGACAEVEGGTASESTARSFFSIIGYSDSEMQMNKLCFSLGSEALQNEDYDYAAAMLKNAGGFANSSALLNESLYQLAIKYVNDGDFATARNIFASLGGYKDSLSRRVDCADKSPANEHRGWYAEVYTSLDGFYTNDFGAGDILTVSGTAGNDSVSTANTDLLVTVVLPDGTVKSDVCKGLYKGTVFRMNVTLPDSISGKVSIAVTLPGTNAVLRKMSVNIA